MPGPADTTALSEDGAAAWFGLLAAHSRLTRQMDARLALEHDLSFSAYEVLYRLDRGEARPVRALAAELVTISPTRASRVVQELVDAGYLRREADQSDGRVSLIGLTPAGRRLARRADRTFYATVRESFLDALSPDDVAALARIWRRLLAAEPLTVGV